MKILLTLIILTLSAVYSWWLYDRSDLNIERVLTSTEWQTNIQGLVIPHYIMVAEPMSLRDLNVKSQVRYLPNGTYLQELTVIWSNLHTGSISHLKISEYGTWTFNDSYLMKSTSKFRETSVSQTELFNAEHVELIKKLLKLEAQKSRRIDVINRKTLLLTTLNQETSLLFSH
ncbi:regulatory protein ToxS [Vibrio hangzhouensis]|uniref:Transmembrane regulatory protein ToxS n=1 Tax=Vibrio hangzhouensis TaxID=462991 RepID=A0A1H6B934_9VIBR|nr:transmembrane regulatory protein ToxS [Vibrio hangzhouensis]